VRGIKAAICSRDTPLESARPYRFVSECPFRKISYSNASDGVRLKQLSDKALASRVQTLSNAQI
jgi:hypothetical protein